jgi:DNA polymerase-3 subunit gamma/tau
MAYQVLARKWRPQNFHTMVGQEHVLRALVHALDEQRLHHAYLFAGTRGVGKTTIARILARCLNCEEGVSSTPCGVCSSCVEITEGRFVDLIEVDAASRTKVEDTRELLDNVQYAPTRGRFKVYLIDEVHMLSTSSFNALLKTLEEPPPHVKFLLATTDPQKLPITVLSRCLQFNLKNMPAEQVAGHLRNVLTSEAIPFAEASLWQLGRAAKGSMRDALSLTDQAIAFCGGDLTESSVNQMLGSIDQGKVVAIVSQLQQGNASELLKTIGELAELGQDFSVALEDLLSLLHQVAICQVLPDAPVSVQFDKAKVLELALNISPADVQLFYQMGIMARKDLEAAPDLQAGFEMALLRMLAFRPQQHAGQMHTVASGPQRLVEPQLPILPTPPEAKQVLAQSQSQQEPTAQLEPSALQEPSAPQEPESMVDPVVELPPWDESPVQEVAAQAQQEVPVVVAEATPEKRRNNWALNDLNENNWIQVFNDLNLSGMTHSIAANMVFINRQDTQLQFTLEQGHSSMLNDTHQSRIRLALGEFFGCDLQLIINVGQVQAETPFSNRHRRETELQDHAITSLQNDPNVDSLITAFNGLLDLNSVLPVNPIEN